MVEAEKGSTTVGTGTPGKIYPRYGAKRKTRLRDRSGISGMPNLREQRGKYVKENNDDDNNGWGEYLAKANLANENISREFTEEISEKIDKIRIGEEKKVKERLFALAGRFIDRVKESLTRNTTKAAKEASEVAHDRTEHQMKIQIGETRFDKDYLLRVQQKIGLNIMRSSDGWRQDTFNKLVRLMIGPTVSAREIEDALAEQEGIIRRYAEMVSRSVLADAYNEFMMVNYDKAAKILGEDPTEVKYRWINPSDRRTTDICRNIMQRTRGGVTKQQLITIIKEESARKLANWWVVESPYLPHPNCRSSIQSIDL